LRRPARTARSAHCTLHLAPVALLSCCIIKPLDCYTRG
jgi:hypothetical protein